MEYEQMTQGHQENLCAVLNLCAIKESLQNCRQI